MSVTNDHKVPNGLWNEWSEEGKNLFNYVFNQLLRLGLELIAHPETIAREAENMSPEEWRTIAWNAACVAAWGATDSTIPVEVVST